MIRRTGNVKVKILKTLVIASLVFAILFGEGIITPVIAGMKHEDLMSLLVDDFLTMFNVYK